MRFLSHTPFFVLIDNTDGLARSRRGALLYAYLASLITNMVTSTYFVGLMLEMGADERYIGAITVTITVCGFLQFLSPLLLENFARRKKLLIILRTLYHFFYIVVIGLIPLLPVQQNTMLMLFMVTVIVANVINAMSLSGLSVWHIQNISEDKRPNFFTLSNVGSQVINTVAGFCASRFIDVFSVKEINFHSISPLMLAFLLLRVVALIAAIGELSSLAVIKEHPYEQKAVEEKQEKGVKMLLTPLTNRLFMKTILIYVFYLFISSMIGKYFEIYLLDIVDMSYTYISLSGVIGLPIVLLLSPMWAFFMKRWSWSKVMPIALVGTATGYFFNTLITPNTQFFHILCSAFYSSFYVAIAIIFAFLPYVNMPETNRTAYISIFTISGSLAGLLGNLAGMLFMSVSEGLEYYLFGLKITNYQTLNLIQTILFLLLAVYTIFSTRTDKTKIHNHNPEKTNQKQF